MPRPALDLTNFKFGRLTVIAREDTVKGSKTKWKCQCDCSNVTSVVSYSLTSGNTTSCGCYSKENKKTRHQAHRDAMIGRVFGKLTVDSYNRTEGKTAFYNCNCSCGNRTVVTNGNLTSGHTKSCGCYISQIMAARNDAYRDELIGRVFDRLTVREFVSHTKPTRYKCECVCGKTITVIGTNLTSGNTTSCGCYANEMTSARFTTHGLSRERIYSIWAGIIQRCTNENHTSYPNYGNKGVSVCDIWRRDFSAFYDWAMAHGYRDDLTIERDNPYGNYEPGNCLWIPATEQARNKRNTQLSVEIAEAIRSDNRRQTDIAKDYGIHQGSVSNIKLNKTWRND